MGWKWAYPGDIPDHAVRCEDTDLGECYLGVSMYSDGICQEFTGKISPKLPIIPFIKERNEMKALKYLLPRMARDGEIGPVSSHGYQ